MKEDVNLPNEKHLKEVKDKIVELVAAEKEILVTIQKWDTLEQCISVREGSL